MNEHLTERITGTTRIFEGKVIKLRRDEVTLPSGRTATREVVEHPGAVAVVPILSDGTVVMVKQYRHPAAKVLLEIPAGKLDSNENPDTCAARELEEETGYRAARFTRLASIYTTPGFSDEIMYIYSAEGLSQFTQITDEDEFIDLEYYTSDELKSLVQEGQIEDAKTLLGLFLAGIL